MHSSSSSSSIGYPYLEEHSGFSARGLGFGESSGGRGAAGRRRERGGEGGFVEFVTYGLVWGSALTSDAHGPEVGEGALVGCALMICASRGDGAHPGDTLSVYHPVCPGPDFVSAWGEGSCRLPPLMLSGEVADGLVNGERRTILV